MSQTKPKPTNNHIPENVVFNIVAWLPVKSVIRFRCVCKSWDSFIISPYFISTHLNNNNSKYHGCFIRVPESFGKKGKVCEVFCDRTYYIISEYPVPSGFDRFYVGSTSAGNGIVGSCNGLLCIPHYKGFCVDVIYLYNPVLRKFKKLPDSSFRKRYDWVAAGFGYQSKTNDYKVIRVCCLVGFTKLGKPKMKRKYAEVYTLSSNSWRRVEISLRPNVRLHGNNRISHAIFACGALHWLVDFIEYEDELQCETKILTFDVYNEKFRDIALPDGGRRTQHIAAFRGKLAFITVNYYDRYITMWVMEEYGDVHESWNKLFSLLIETGFFYGCTRYAGLPDALQGNSTYVESLVLLDEGTELSG